jgi:hypothetical protein
MKTLSQSTSVAVDTLELSVVMPCLNEEKTIGSCISKAIGAMASAGIKGEVIIADNGSTDRSVEIAESLGARVIHETAKGYGNALMAGFDAAHGRFLLMGDADDSYDFSDIQPFVEKLREGYDLVIGTRIKGKILPGAMPWKNRYLGNPALTTALNLLFHANTSDAHSGMRGFTADAYRRMTLRTPGMEFASEMIIKAAKLGLRVTEIPITFYPDRRDRPPHLRPWRDGWRHLKFMLMFSPSALFLVPGLGLLGIGLLLMCSQFLAPADAPLRPFGFKMDFHWAILGSLLTLVGYQVVSTHFQAKIYSVTHRFQEEDPWLRKGFRVLTLERALLIGLVVAAIGLAIDLNVLLEWMGNQEGLFVQGQTRQAIFGSTLLALGIQTTLNAFFFSIIGDAYKYGFHAGSDSQKGGRA